MPTKSKKQYNFMQGIAHNSIIGSGVPKNVAKEFVRETPKNKRHKFAKALMHSDKSDKSKK